MKKVVQDFLELTLFGNLSGDGTKDVTNVGGPPTMVDQLEFQTPSRLCDHRRSSSSPWVRIFSLRMQASA